MPVDPRDRTRRTPARPCFPPSTRRRPQLTAVVPSGWTARSVSRRCAGTRKVRNVARDPRVSVSVSIRDADVVIEGTRCGNLTGAVARIWDGVGGHRLPAEPDESGSVITAPFNAPSACHHLERGVPANRPRSSTVVLATEPGGLTPSASDAARRHDCARATRRYLRSRPRLSGMVSSHWAPAAGSRGGRRPFVPGRGELVSGSCRDGVPGVLVHVVSFPSAHPRRRFARSAGQWRHAAIDGDAAADILRPGFMQKTSSRSAG